MPLTGSHGLASTGGSDSTVPNSRVEGTYYNYIRHACKEALYTRFQILQLERHSWRSKGHQTASRVAKSEIECKVLLYENDVCSLTWLFLFQACFICTRMWRLHWFVAVADLFFLVGSILVLWNSGWHRLMFLHMWFPFFWLPQSSNFCGLCSSVACGKVLYKRLFTLHRCFSLKHVVKPHVTPCSQ